MSIQHDLLAAVESCDLVAIQQLILAGADIDWRCDGSNEHLAGGSVLFLAILNGEIAVVQKLLELGADPNFVATEPARSVYADKPLEVVMGAQFLLDWNRYTPIYALLVRFGATDNAGLVPDSKDEADRRRRALEWQASRSDQYRKS